MAIEFNDAPNKVIVNPRDVNKVIVEEQVVHVQVATGGPQGATGAQGVQGVQGRQGVQGTQGIQGQIATQGTQGIQGIQGPQGTQGITGTQGVTGTQGTQGVQGTQGIQGTTGTQGLTGIQGTQGVQGIQGIQGTQGLQGIQGTTGSQGTQGTQGLTGTQGAQGTQGLIGIQGTTGSQGATGAQGTTGAQGLVGTQGAVGTQGLTGAQGTTGAQGLVGSQGVTGLQGITGLQGTQGVQGLVGSQGTTGLQGVTGSQGTTGTQGLVGSQGVQGVQGRQGTQGVVGQQASITHQDAAPSSPYDGQLWYDTVNNRLFIWYVDVDSSQWVEVAAGYANDLSATTSIIPAVDNTYTLGNSNYRWTSIHLGPGTLYITDQTVGYPTAEVSVNAGVFNINGIAQAQLPNLKVTNLIFNDNTTQTTAAGIPVSYNPTWSGTGLTFTGTPATGSYMKVGKLVTFRFKVLCTTVTNFGTGQYSITLPFNVATNYQFQDGAIHRASNGNHYPLKAHADSGNVMTLWDGAGATDIIFDHNSPYTLTVNDYFYLTGTYEAQ